MVIACATRRSARKRQPWRARTNQSVFQKCATISKSLSGAVLQRALLVLMTIALVVTTMCGSPAADHKVGKSMDIAKTLGIWQVEFSPQYMVPGQRRNVPATFYLMLSPAGHDSVMGKAVWNYGNEPDDSTHWILASVAGALDKDKLLLSFCPPTQPGGNAPFTLSGSFTNADITGSTVQTRANPVSFRSYRYNGGKVSGTIEEQVQMPQQSTFRLQRLKPIPSNPTRDEDVKEIVHRAEGSK